MSKPATEARLAAAAKGFTQVIGRGNVLLSIIATRFASILLIIPQNALSRNTGLMELRRIE